MYSNRTRKRWPIRRRLPPDAVDDGARGQLSGGEQSELSGGGDRREGAKALQARLHLERGRHRGGVGGPENHSRNFRGKSRRGLQQRVHSQGHQRSVD